MSFKPLTTTLPGDMEAEAKSARRRFLEEPGLLGMRRVRRVGIAIGPSAQWNRGGGTSHMPQFPWKRRSEDIEQPKPKPGACLRVSRLKMAEGKSVSTKSIYIYRFNKQIPTR